MGGELLVESTDRLGSVFTVRLPAAAAMAGPAAGEVSMHTPGRAEVLYVEDDPVNVEVMRAVLSARRAVDLKVAGTLAEAVAALQSSRPRLLLLDMHLPDGDGDELLRRLRADPGFATLQVLVVSADAQTQGESRAAAAGADGYFSKPIDFDALLARIDTILAG